MRYLNAIFICGNGIRSHDDLTQWLKFFLEGVHNTSENSIQTFKNIIALRSEVEHKIIKLGKKQALAREFLQYLYSNPSIDANDVAKVLQISLLYYITPD